MIEDRVLVVSVKSGPWSDMVGMYMLKSAGKRNQLLVYIDQLFPVAKVQSLHHASPRPVKWIGWQCDPPRISSGQDAMPHWPVVPSIF